MWPPSRRAFLLGCATATAGLTGCALPGTLTSTRTSEEVTIPADRALVVAIHSGDILVEDGVGDTAILEVEKSTRHGAEVLDRVAVETSTTEAEYRVGISDDTPPGKTVTVDVTLYLPGDVPVARLETDNGDVTARDVPGDATLESTNGDVLADGVDGFVTLRSGNGDLEARRIAGLDAARTTNGDIDVEVPAIRGAVRVGTTNGNVRAAVAEDLDAVLDLQTATGYVGYSGLSLQPSVDRATHVRGTLGAGGSQVTVESTNGNVRVRPL